MICARVRPCAHGVEGARDASVATRRSCFTFGAPRACTATRDTICPRGVDGAALLLLLLLLWLFPDIVNLKEGIKKKNTPFKECFGFWKFLREREMEGKRSVLSE